MSKHRHSNFTYFIDEINKGTDSIKEREQNMGKPNVTFVKEAPISDIEYFKRVLQESERIGIQVLWGFDEQQADPFHKNFNSDEFVRRLKRIIAGEPKTYGKTTLEYSGERPK